MLVVAADQPDAVWLADISYIPTGEGWLYLAAIKDMATREIVGSVEVTVNEAFGLHLPETGGILIDGHDVRQYDPELLRRQDAERGRFRRLVGVAADRLGDVFRGHLLAIVELDVLAQLEADALAVIQFFPAFGKAGHQLQVRAAIGQAIEDIGRNGGPLNQKRIDRVPAARVLGRGDRHFAGGGGRGAHRDVVDDDIVGSGIVLDLLRPESRGGIVE